MHPARVNIGPNGATACHGDEAGPSRRGVAQTLDRRSGLADPGIFRCSAHAIARADTRHSPGCACAPSPTRAHRATHAAPNLYYSQSADSMLVLPLKKGYPAAVQPILEVRAKQYNLFGVHVARLIHADLDPTNNIVFGLDAHSFFPITQQTADCCANRRCRGVLVEQFNSITRFEI